MLRSCKLFSSGAGSCSVFSGAPLGKLMRGETEVRPCAVARLDGGD